VALGGLEPLPVGEGLPQLSWNLGIFVGGDLSVCTADVRVQSSSVAFTVQIPQRCQLTGLLTKHSWMVLYFSSPQQQQQHHTHFISFHARFRHCCIQLSMKRWCQLNRARVAHDARLALSSYQNMCSKPGRSHHNSDICNLWSLTVLHYDSTDWNLWSGQRRRPIIKLGSTSSCGAYMAVYVC